MKRRFYTRPAPALAALAGSAALLLGACTATDSAGNMSAATAASQSQNKPRSGGGAASPDASPKPADTAHADGIRRMRPDELQKLVEDGKAVVYDTRSKMSYDQEHIKGALSMPHEEAGARAAEFPRDKTLVFYCT
jgi:hypothetical protein